MDNISTAVTKADLAAAVTDERGVKYSPDGLRLFEAPPYELSGSYTIKPGTKVICDYAFEGCTVTGITIPDGVMSIGDSAFRWCTSLKSIKTPNGVTVIGRFAFMKCLSLASIIIPDSVTVIGSYAFRMCRSLKSINIPDSVKYIDHGAFLWCRSLSDDTREEIVRRFGQQPFK